MQKYPRLRIKNKTGGKKARETLQDTADTVLCIAIEGTFLDLQ